MNKQDIAIVALLFVAMLGWMYFFRPDPRPVPPQTPQAAEAPATNGPAAARAETVPAEPDAAPVLPGAAELSAAPQAEPAASVAPAEPEAPALPEARYVLRNDALEYEISSKGAAVVSAVLRQYKEANREDSGPVVLGFETAPALSYHGLPGLSAGSDFEITVSEDGAEAVMERTGANGLRLVRILTLTEGHVATVKDEVTNLGDTTLLLPEHRIRMGPMEIVRNASAMRGMSYLGLDIAPEVSGQGVQHWGRKKLPGLFGGRTGMLSCSQAPVGAMPEHAEASFGQPVLWAAAKNKFFAQILAPEGAASDCEVMAERDTDASALDITKVNARLVFAGEALEPGASIQRTFTYYTGPKKYSALKAIGVHWDEVMEFGFFKPICKLLLPTLNAIYRVLPNYGVAIILLTVLVRLIFWPITHKSTESMKKMQAIQPHVTVIREKYKNDPQRMNKEVMALYREHKVNPMAGCLPMLVQIPVFIGLFTVLRSAVELRFAEFLWISDLSEPEGLLAGVLPFPASGLNILPLYMTVSMVLQQQLTPTAGDPQQKKMMMFMPVIMLVLFYGMPSALVLYWSTSQTLAIVQLLMQRRKSAAKAA